MKHMTCCIFIFQKGARGGCFVTYFLILYRNEIMNIIKISFSMFRPPLTENVFSPFYTKSKKIIKHVLLKKKSYAGFVLPHRGWG